jgi:hypothetical protein
VNPIIHPRITVLCPAPADNERLHSVWHFVSQDGHEDYFDDDDLGAGLNTSEQAGVDFTVQHLPGIDPAELARQQVEWEHDQCFHRPYQPIAMSCDE